MSYIVPALVNGKPTTEWTVLTSLWINLNVNDNLIDATYSKWLLEAYNIEVRYNHIGTIDSYAFSSEQDYLVFMIKHG